MNDLQNEFHAAAEEYRRRLAAQKEAAESKRKTTTQNGELFAAAMQAKLDQQSHDTAAIFGYNI